MSQKVLSGSIALTKMTSMILTTKKGTKCIMLPIKENYFTEKDGAVYMNVNVVVKDEQDQYGQNGFIAQKMDAETYKAMGKEAANAVKLPILGNIKDFGMSANDAGGATEIPGQANPEEDDLPF